MSVFVIASVRTQIADFLDALITVYWIILFAYILSTLIAQFGRIPYAAWSSAIIGFLRDVSEPYLRLFKFIPPIGPIDVSPIVAILLLVVGGRFIVALIHG